MVPSYVKGSDDEVEKNAVEVELGLGSSGVRFELDSELDTWREWGRSGGRLVGLGFFFLLCCRDIKYDNFAWVVLVNDWRTWFDVSILGYGWPVGLVPRPVANAVHKEIVNLLSSTYSRPPTQSKAKRFSPRTTNSTVTET